MNLSVLLSTDVTVWLHTEESDNSKCMFKSSLIMDMLPLVCLHNGTFSITTIIIIIITCQVVGGFIHFTLGVIYHFSSLSSVLSLLHTKHNNQSVQ